MAEYDLKAGFQPHELRSRLLDNIEQIHADGDMQLNAFVLQMIGTRP